MKTIRDLKITNRRVFIRLDLNVPLSAPDADGERHIEDENRIVEALPTIQYAIAQGARVILGSHLGRPGGQRNLEFSLEPIAKRLAVLLGQEVTLADDCTGDGIELMAQSLKSGQVLLLENLRFYPDEEANTSKFARALARLADVYISDAFGTAHRKHASTYGMPAVMLERGIGFLIEKELKYLEPLLNQPKRPFFALLGGAKVSDKIKTLDSLMRQVDGLLIGGAMAHAFTVAQGGTLPPKVKAPKTEDVDAARSLTRSARKREIPLLIPIDTVDGCDIGPKTVELFSEVLSKTGTVFWNGPLGWFEKPEFAAGTFAIAKFLATQTHSIRIVGGGDTVAAIHQAGVSSDFDHLSTGGGAVLEYLEGNGLPGIDVLKLSQRELAQLGSTLSLPVDEPAESDQNNDWN